MKIDKLLIGLALASLVMVTMILFVGDMNANYKDVGTNISTDDMGNSYNQIDEVYDISQEMKNKTLGTQLSDDSPLDAAIGGSFEAIRLIKSSFVTMGVMANDIASAVGIPSYFLVFLSAIITIAVIFALIYLVWRPA